MRSKIKSTNLQQSEIEIDSTARVDPLSVQTKMPNQADMFAAAMLTVLKQPPNLPTHRTQASTVSADCTLQERAHLRRPPKRFCTESGCTTSVDRRVRWCHVMSSLPPPFAPLVWNVQLFCQWQSTAVQSTDAQGSCVQIYPAYLP